KRWWGHAWRAGDVRYIPNIGVDCGRSGLLTLDLDEYKDHYAGTELLAKADRETITAISGGGGEHLYYASLAKPYGNKTGELPAGVDVRGAGGYVVAAPSLHHSGRRYQWEAGYGPHEIAPLPIPAALDEILATAHATKAAYQVNVTFATANTEA